MSWYRLRYGLFALLSGATLLQGIGSCTEEQTAALQGILFRALLDSVLGGFAT